MGLQRDELIHLSQSTNISWLEERGRENSFISLDFSTFTTLRGYMDHYQACVSPPPHPLTLCLPGMLSTRLDWAAVSTAFPLKHLSITIMFVPFVSQWLRDGPALRCFRGNTSLHCQLDVNGVQPARVKEQLMESVVLFLLI